MHWPASLAPVCHHAIADVVLGVTRTSAYALFAAEPVFPHKMAAIKNTADALSDAFVWDYVKGTVKMAVESK